MNPWSRRSWRDFPVAQAPEYAYPELVCDVEARLREYPALVLESEILDLRRQLASASRGEAFLLHGGDCAESFSDLRAETIRDNFKVFLQMAVVLTFGAKRRVVKVGRVAGQFAKPRSSAVETRDGQSLPSYRGDIINGHDFTPESRAHDPARMERAYFQSAATLNTLRALTKGGFADLHKVQSWNLEFARRSHTDPRYSSIVDRLTDSLAFMQAAGVSLPPGTALDTTELFTSHEALLLPYEEALVRASETQPTGYFAGSAHMLWIGERSRQLDGAHVEFARGVANPIGLKCGPDLRADDLLRLCDRLDPANEPGRLTLITRMGASRISLTLPKLLRRLQGEGRHVLWSCDPMHGNSVASCSGIKTRSFDDILAETRAFFAIHAAEGTVAGGVHLELTGKDVTECLGGGQNINGVDLASKRYETLCDPRLNASQALELAFELVQR
jgi:3-deoxy-7-phosphoheptulonate synthase